MNTSKLTPKINVISQVSIRTRSTGNVRRTLHNSIRKSGLKDRNNLVGNFVLPSRSVHSSRVIKPNKRFINVDSTDVRIFKRKVQIKKATQAEGKLNPDKPKNNPLEADIKTGSAAANKSETLKSESVVRSVKSKSCVSDIANKNLIKTSAAKFKDIVRDSHRDKLEADNSYSKSLTSCSKSPTSCSKNRPLLREARLQIGSCVNFSAEGPFSLITNAAGTPSCGVCGAVRSNRFLKQGKKFTILNCDSCRNFISRMIRRQKCKGVDSTLKCFDGRGLCHVPQVINIFNHKDSTEKDIT